MLPVEPGAQEARAHCLPTHYINKIWRDDLDSVTIPMGLLVGVRLSAFHRVGVEGV